MNVLDTTALVSFLLLEPGAEKIGDLIEDSCISAVSLSELIGRFGYDGIAVEDVLAQLKKVDIEVVPFDREQAAYAGELIVTGRHQGLSIGDAAALSLAHIRRCPIYTKVRTWKELNTGIDIRLLSEVAAASVP